MSQPIAFEHNHLLIDGRPRVLLCASLFPFRVAREQWRQRLEAVKSIGYHAIDVYIPWNFHETEPGVWDFEGQHDIEAFLAMAGEIGLYALVRPGPYICSEWDGGAIPAWIATDPDLDIRQNDPAFLEAVRGWYDKVMPIIARQQYAGANPDGSFAGGPVVMVQVDNELDFFACRDPKGYIGALAAMMRGHGVTVPLISCAGQGDMLRAFGGAEDVSPAVNIYPGDNDVDVDAQVRFYRRASDAHDVPTIVTETNRWHRTLRRLAGNGAVFLGPFLQVSGWDFDYGTGVTNWGRIEAYMTHDYDFGGVIDPSGQERPDADDARRLSAVIGALGERLASATLPEDGDRLDGIAYVADGSADRALDEHRDRVAVGVLDLAGGGRLLTLTNVSWKDVRLRVGREAALPTLDLPAGAGVMVVRGLQLNQTGLSIEATSGELIALDGHARTLTIAAPTMAPGRVWVALDGVSRAEAAQGSDVDVRRSGGLTLVEGMRGEIVVESNGERWTLTLVQPERKFQASSAPQIEASGVTAGVAEPAWTPRREEPAAKASPLEEWGVYRGAGRYRAGVDLTGAIGVVLGHASDTVSLRYGELETAWRANGGEDLWVPFEASVAGKADALSVTARIWGHSNFDDTRLNALRLKASRGIDGALAVFDRLDIGSGWIVDYDHRDPDGERRLREAGLVIGDAPKPRGGVGGRSTTVWPHTLSYTRTLDFGDCDAALHVEDGQTRWEVLLNDRTLGVITPLRPTLRLGHVRNGDELTVVVTKSWGENFLLVGEEIVGWTLESQGVDELRAAGATCAFGGEGTAGAAALPLRLAAGEHRWLRVPAKALAGSAHAMNTVVRFEGTGLQLTAFTDRHCLGRVVLGGLPGTTFAGGRGDLFLVPEGEGDLLLYAEPTLGSAADEPAHLDRILLGGPLDRR